MSDDLRVGICLCVWEREGEGRRERVCACACARACMQIAQTHQVSAGGNLRTAGDE